MPAGRQFPWPEVQLGEILQEQNETPDMERIEDGTIPIIAKIGFSSGIMEFRDRQKTRTKLILAYPGDIVISGINAAKGAIAINIEPIPVAATIHYTAYAPDKCRVNTKYLWHLLRSDTFRRILERALPGGVKTELRPTRLLPIRIPLPPREEQHYIVGRIEHYTDLIEEAYVLRTQSYVTTMSLIESCIQDVLSQFPETRKFGEVVTFKPRSGPSFRTDPDWKGTPVLMPSSVTGFGVDTRRVEYGFGDEEIREKDRLMPGDILIARGNKPDQVGNAGIVPRKAKNWVCANLLMKLQVDSSVADPHFCIYWLRSPQMRAYVKQHMKGTNPSIQKINQRTILGFPFPANIVLAEQRRIVAHLDDLQAQVDNLTALQDSTQAELEALLSSVLDRAFRGEL